MIYLSFFTGKNTQKDLNLVYSHTSTIFSSQIPATPEGNHLAFLRQLRVSAYWNLPDTVRADIQKGPLDLFQQKSLFSIKAVTKHI